MISVTQETEAGPVALWVAPMGGRQWKRFLGLVGRRDEFAGWYNTNPFFQTLRPNQTRIMGGILVSMNGVSEGQIALLQELGVGYQFCRIAPVERPQL